LALSRESQSYTLRWWDTANGKLLHTTTNTTTHRILPPGAAALSADGTLAATVGEDGMATLLDARSFNFIATFKASMLGLNGVAFSPDSQRLATGGSGRESVKLWDLSTGRELLVLAAEGMFFQSLAFSPNGDWLAATAWKGSATGSVCLYLWHAPSWAEIGAAEKSTEGKTE
jgi:WD40 repeat protein